jgi:hypothetical protein
VTVQDICTHYADFLKSHPQAAPSSGFADLVLRVGGWVGGCGCAGVRVCVRFLMRAFLIACMRAYVRASVGGWGG